VVNETCLILVQIINTPGGGCHDNKLFVCSFLRRSKVRRAAEGEFPGDAIPTFRSNPDASRRLENLVKQLSKTCTIKEVDFGEGNVILTL